MTIGVPIVTHVYTKSAEYTKSRWLVDGVGQRRAIHV